MQTSDQASARLPTLGDEELHALSVHATTKSFPKNTVIVNEGDETDSLYVILSGRVKVYVSDDDGKEIVLATQEAGEYFGEMVLDQGPRSASVMTLEASKFAIVPKSQFKTFLLEHPQFSIRVIELTAKRLEFLKETVPSSSRVMVLHDPNYADELVTTGPAAAAAQKLKLKLKLVPVAARNVAEIQAAFKSAAKEHINALLVLRAPLMVNNTAPL